jgi:hypothetical protein
VATDAAITVTDSAALDSLLAVASTRLLDPRSTGVAAALEQRGRTADAFVLLTRVVAADSTTPCRSCDALPVLARVAYAADSSGVGETALRRWMQRDATAPEPVRRLAQQLVREGRFAEAAVLVDSAKSRGASTLWARQQRMERAMAGGFWPVARDLVVDSTAEGMTGARARWWRVAFERLRGRPASAAAFARPLLATGVPAIAGQLDAALAQEVRAAVVTALLDAGDVNGARTVLAEPVARRDSAPLLLDDVALRGRVLAAQSDSTALRTLVDSVAASPMPTIDARTLALRGYLRGLAAATRGAHGEALPHFEAALRVDRVTAPAINVALARSLTALGRPADAIPVLRAATRAPILPTGATAEPFPAVREQLALAHAAIGARDSARVHARIVLDAWNESEAVMRVRTNALRRAVGLGRRPRTDSAAAGAP